MIGMFHFSRSAHQKFQKGIKNTLMLTSVGTMNISDGSFNDIFECIHIFKLEKTLTIALMTQVSKTLLPYFFSVKILQYFLFLVYA